MVSKVNTCHARESHFAIKSITQTSKLLYPETGLHEGNERRCVCPSLSFFVTSQSKKEISEENDEKIQSKIKRHEVLCCNEYTLLRRSCYHNEKRWQDLQWWRIRETWSPFSLHGETVTIIRRVSFSQKDEEVANLSFFAFRIQEKKPHQKRLPLMLLLLCFIWRLRRKKLLRITKV